MHTCSGQGPAELGAFQEIDDLGGKRRKSSEATEQASDDEQAYFDKEQEVGCFFASKKVT